MDVRITDAASFDNVTAERNRVFTVQTDSPATHPIEFNNVSIFPAFCDVHVHLREPGFLYKETIATGSLAAAHGGYTDVCAMPNLNPVPDSVSAIILERSIIRETAVMNIRPYAPITIGEKGEKLVNIEALAPLCVAFSDDGHGVQDEGIMREAMYRAAAAGKIIAAHCEDNSLLNGGYIHDGEYCRAHGHRGICSKSEYGPIERDLKLAKETGCKYHVCHVSAKESVELIRAAKADGVDVTCETAPHYLIFDDSMLQEDGRFKMNPPIRSRADRDALIEGVIDGTIDMIATDHAPHSKREKSRGLAGSLMGVVGLETAFPALYTGLVKTGIIDIERLLAMMSRVPRERFNIPDSGDVCVYDLNVKKAVDPSTFLTKGRSTPFEGMELYGECVMTIHGGKAIWIKG